MYKGDVQCATGVQGWRSFGRDRIICREAWNCLNHPLFLKERKMKSLFGGDVIGLLTKMCSKLGKSHILPSPVCGD